MSGYYVTTMNDKQRAEIKNFGEKIVVNAGLGRLSQQPNFEEKILPAIIKDLSLISGQRPQVCRSKRSIAGFKMREGQIIGARSTLRGKRLVDFFERFITMVLPRVRDFSGLALSTVDQGGVLNVGIKEHMVFPEINPDETNQFFSLQVSIVPKDKDRKKAITFYRQLGVPLKKE